TLTLATQAGVILGTAAYMSPEQASGAIADKRSDVWAFGVVLWELLTGKRLFDGETVSHTLAYVLTKEPDWTALPANTPSSIRRLLRRCLEKDRKKRLADITSARMEIDDAIAAPAEAIAASASTPVPRSRERAWLWGMATIAALALVVALTVWARSPRSSELRATRLTADLGVSGALAYNAGAGASVAISPDGHVIAFVAFSSRSTAGGGAQSQLYVRRLDQLKATALPGSDDAHSPFFSPDGQWIGFF